jgi:hypothetical protein
MLSFNGARQISGNSVTMSILIGRGGSSEPSKLREILKRRAIEVNRPYLLDNFQDGTLAVARGGTGQQGTNSLNSLSASPNHTADISSPKLQFEGCRPAVWNFCQHDIVRKFNQLPDDELEKLSHA